MLLCDLFCGPAFVQLSTYLSWKASSSLGSKIFSSGSHVLYLFREENVNSERAVVCQEVGG